MPAQTSDWRSGSDGVSRVCARLRQAERSSNVRQTGDMNILAIPKKNTQPKNLLKINKYDEDWDQEKLIEFYNDNKLQII